MKARSMGAMALSVLLASGAAGCKTGKPGFRAETMRPDQQHDFAVLYKDNCSACHGDRGMSGAALPLDNPVYLTWAGHDRLIEIVANGVPHRLMPGFSATAGGFLTDSQIENIVHGMLSQWTKPGILNGANIPAYTPATPGDARQGKAAFQIYCARCHGPDGAGVPPGDSAAAKGLAVGSIVDPTYLSLISPRALRDVIVTGWPRENMPDWRGDVGGNPMTGKDVTDIVAWLGSHHVHIPGKTFPSSSQQRETSRHSAERE